MVCTLARQRRWTTTLSILLSCGWCCKDPTPAPTAVATAAAAAADTLTTGEVLPDSSYSWDEEECELLLHSVPARPFQLKAVTAIHPEQHTDLEGMFCVGGVYATQVRQDIRPALNRMSMRRP